MSARAKTALEPDLSAFTPPVRCLLGRWIDTSLPEADRATLAVAFESHLTSYQIHGWLEARDCPTTQQTTWRHRTGRCGCRPRRAKGEA